MRLSSIIVGTCLLILVSTGFLLFLAEGVNKYSPSNVPTDYNSSFIRLQSTLSNLSDVTGRTDNALSNFTAEDTGFFDFLGFYFAKGYQAAKVLVSAVSLNTVIIDEAVDNGLGATGMASTIKAVGLLLVVIFILFLLLSFIIKSDWI